MEYFTGLVPAVVDNWPVWTVTIVLILAAVIDGFELKVPNWITFPIMISGWVYSMAFGNAGMTGKVSAGACSARSSAWPCCCRLMPSAAWVPAT